MKTMFIGIKACDEAVAEAHDGPTWLLWGEVDDLAASEPWLSDPVLTPLSQFPSVDHVVFSATFLKLVLDFGRHRGEAARNVVRLIESEGRLL